MFLMSVSVINSEKPHHKLGGAVFFNVFDVFLDVVDVFLDVVDVTFRCMLSVDPEVEK